MNLDCSLIFSPCSWQECQFLIILRPEHDLSDLLESSSQFIEESLQFLAVMDLDFNLDITSTDDLLEPYDILVHICPRLYFGQDGIVVEIDFQEIVDIS